MGCISGRSWKPQEGGKRVASGYYFSGLLDIGCILLPEGSATVRQSFCRAQCQLLLWSCLIRLTCGHRSLLPRSYWLILALDFPQWPNTMMSLASCWYFDGPRYPDILLYSPFIHGIYFRFFFLLQTHTSVSSNGWLWGVNLGLSDACVPCIVPLYKIIREEGRNQCS